MSLSKLYFTKNWENPSDFPTYEDREAQVRADLQLLHDETKAAFNKLIDDLAASEIPFRTSDAVPAVNVQDAIDNVQSQVAGLLLDELVLPDRSVAGDKLALKAVGTDELDDGAVTTAKLHSGAVTSAKIGTGEVKQANIGAGAVNDSKMAPNAPTYKADLDDGIVARTQLRLRKKSVGTPYTITAADAGSVIAFSGSSIYLPSTDTILLGSVVVVVNSGANGTVFNKGSSAVQLFVYGRTVGVDYVVTPPRATTILIKLATSIWAVGVLSAGIDIPPD